MQSNQPRKIIPSFRSQRVLVLLFNNHNYFSFHSIWFIHIPEIKNSSDLVFSDLFDLYTCTSSDEPSQRRELFLVCSRQPSPSHLDFVTNSIDRGPSPPFLLFYWCVSQRTSGLVTNNVQCSRIPKERGNYTWSAVDWSTVTIYKKNDYEMTNHDELNMISALLPTFL